MKICVSNGEKEEREKNVDLVEKPNKMNHMQYINVVTYIGKQTFLDTLIQ